MTWNYADLKSAYQALSPAPATLATISSCHTEMSEK